MSDGESKAASTGGNRAPEEIREEIEETREELGDTVAAVTEKTDVKKQAQAKVDEVKAASPDTPALAIAGVLVGLLVLWRLLRR
jgi:F0F1-type ATP synthase assembly protein I